MDEDKKPTEDAKPKIPTKEELAAMGIHHSGGPRDPNAPANIYDNESRN